MANMLSSYNLRLNNLGVSMLEMLLAVAVLGALFAVSLPLVRQNIFKSDAQSAAISYTQFLRRAQVLSMGVEGDSQWGVRAQTSSIVLFKGSSYGARDSSFDEVFSIPNTVSITGVSEVVFNKVSGKTSNTGTTTFTDNGASNSVTINSAGVVSL